MKRFCIYWLQPGRGRAFGLLGLLSLLHLAACQSTGPKASADPVALPASYQHAMVPTSGGSSQSAHAVRSNWWYQFGSEELNQLVDRALAQNADLRVATLQVAQSKIRADQARAGRLPNVSAPVRLAQTQGSYTDVQQYSQVGLAATFRLDVWGEQRALADSADMLLKRAVHERENTQRNVIGNLVNLYVGYLSINDSLWMARQGVSVAEDILKTVERRMALGDATADDLEQQRAQWLSQKATLPILENQKEDLRNNISRLVGTLPGNLKLSEQGLNALSMPKLEAGIPSALVLGRPDVRLMEARMRAANANIEVARARLLPSVDLASQAGYTGTSLATLLSPQNYILSNAATLAVSVFDGGTRRGEQAFAQTFYEEMVETYGKTLLQAVREVESSLATVKAGTQRYEAQKAVTQSAQNIFKISSDAYAVGAIGQTSLLESQKNLQRSQDETQRTKADLLRSYTNLAYALGLGSVLQEPPEAFDALKKTKLAQGQNLRVVGYDGIPRAQLDASTATPTSGQWAAELPGVFHRSSLLPMWRDIDARFAQAWLPSGKLGLRAVQVDQLSPEVGADESWFRVFVTGFQSQQSAAEFCDTLLKSGQACKAAQAREPEPKSKPLRWFQ